MILTLELHDKILEFGDGYNGGGRHERVLERGNCSGCEDLMDALFYSRTGGGKMGVW